MDLENTSETKSNRDMSEQLQPPLAPTPTDSTGKNLASSTGVPPVKNQESYAQPPNALASIAVVQDGKRLKGILHKRLEELHVIEKHLATRASRLSIYYKIAKTIVLVSGAFVATKEVLSPIISSPTVSSLIFIFLGALIAILTGLETAFNWSILAGKFGTLSATCQDIRQQIKFSEELLIDDNNANNILELGKLLHTVTTKLQTVQNEAAGLGEDIVTLLEKEGKKNNK